jgi:hypothetical protein
LICLIDGYHHHAEINKKIYRIGSGSDEDNASTKSDINKKVIMVSPTMVSVKNEFLILKSSIPRTKKRDITIRKSLMVHTSRRDLDKVQLKFIDTSSKFGVSILAWALICSVLICYCLAPIFPNSRRNGCVFRNAHGPCLVVLLPTCFFVVMFSLPILCCS